MTSINPIDATAIADIIVAPAPTVHLNGTSRESLREEAFAALGALSALKAALQNLTLHQRDFYILPDAIEQHAAALRGAQAQHRALVAIEHHLTKRIAATEQN